MPEDIHDPSEKLEYNHIIDHVFIGTNMCCQTHFEEELLKAGVNADISVEDEHLDAPFGVDTFLWLPTKDHTAPNPAQLQQGIALIKQLGEQNIKIYVHCRLGHGRAPTLVAAYLIQEKGMSAQEAADLITEKRPVVHLEGNQMETLIALEK